jgi:hypothetical protein
MTVLMAAHAILVENGGRPMHYEEISRKIIQRELHAGHGRAFPRTVYSRMSEEIRRSGEGSRFVRFQKGCYGLRTNT